jgi:hypothetical protein
MSCGKHPVSRNILEKFSKVKFGFLKIRGYTNKYAPKLNILLCKTIYMVSTNKTAALSGQKSPTVSSYISILKYPFTKMFSEIADLTLRHNLNLFHEAQTTLTFPPHPVLLHDGEECNHPHHACSPDCRSQPM